MGRKCGHIEWYPCITCALKVGLFGLPFVRFKCPKCKPNLNPCCRPCTAPPFILCDDGETCAGCWVASPEDDYIKPSLLQALELRLKSITLDTCAMKEGRNISLATDPPRRLESNCSHIQWSPCIRCWWNILLYGLPHKPNCTRCTPQLMPASCNLCRTSSKSRPKKA